jgi:hypothetical protein
MASHLQGGQGVGVPENGYLIGNGPVRERTFAAGS